MVNVTAPSVTLRDVDEFETRFDEFMRLATPEDITEAVHNACVYIENLCENGGPYVEDKLNQVNNATSTFTRCTRMLVNRLRLLENQNVELRDALELAQDEIREANTR